LGTETWKGNVLAVKTSSSTITEGIGILLDCGGELESDTACGGIASKPSSNLWEGMSKCQK
tara:strand:+ start:556 stop:738 length:183 start_codon:yes stop_codon:yes gene_type:complete